MKVMMFVSLGDLQLLTDREWIQRKALHVRSFWILLGKISATLQILENETPVDLWKGPCFINCKPNNQCCLHAYMLQFHNTTSTQKTVIIATKVSVPLTNSLKIWCLSIRYLIKLPTTSYSILVHINCNASLKIYKAQRIPTIRTP